MKHIILSLFIVIQIGCTNKSDKNDVAVQKNSEPQQTLSENNISKKTDLSEYYTKLDSIHWDSGRGDLITYEKTSYNQVIDDHPEFFGDYLSPPEISYKLSFDFEYNESEVGQDDYFILYAHFLKKKNGDEKLKIERQKLINIYSNINSIFQVLQDGGTYFGHQYYRIIGFAEYSLFIMPKNKSEFDKTYNILTQKELYIKSLRQLINDESSVVFESITEEDKLEKIKELNILINEIDTLISDIFFLRRAQEFQYTYYEYY